MHQSSLDKMTRFRDSYLAGRGDLTIYDIGSQDVNGCYRPMFAEPSWRYVGIDMTAGENVDMVLRNPFKWDEIASSSVDVVISGQAIEHIEFFWMTMLEVERVLKSNGLCCIIAPAGGFEHRYPVDCWRFYPDGFRALTRFARLQPIEIFTQWESQGYADGSDLWQDSVLIARKPSRSRTDALRKAVRRRLLQFASRV
ncbi:MAG: methyltransferase domain-containing protein [Acidithiobacillus sp.]